MKLTLGELRRIIREALVDKMREVPGPNSRDDTDDRELPKEGRSVGERKG